MVGRQDLTVVGYCGHPKEKPRTRRDLAKIIQHAPTLSGRLILACDVNMDDDKLTLEALEHPDLGIAVCAR